MIILLAALLAAICEVSFAWKPSRKTVTTCVGGGGQADESFTIFVFSGSGL